MKHHRLLRGRGYTSSQVPALCNLVTLAELAGDITSRFPSDDVPGIRQCIASPDGLQSECRVFPLSVWSHISPRRRSQ